LFGFFRKRQGFDDRKKQEFVDAISTMFKVQLVVVGDSIDDQAGNINPKALGYIYGFIDAALRTIGQDMGDESIGIPMTFQVLRQVFPGREEEYLGYLIEHMGHDQIVTAAAAVGGQQYLDFNNGKLAAPMGLARYVLDERR
jgi:hypothetical protein